ncbi:hypothetical protein A988_07374 [Pseudomonas syringae BRIP39023]|nr:hypothetical protein A988_07374 [Pseudomonas syringae BRIP39023]PBP40847.1 hypothetical protein CCL13_20815 [Pseudomonas syringae]
MALYTDFVGASLLAKAIAQTPCFLRLHWPIREQARSHMTGALRGMHTGVVDDDMRPTPKHLALYTDFVGASLLAKAIGQTPCFLRLYWPIREQARSHRIDKRKTWERNLGIFKRTTS